MTRQTLVEHWEGRVRLLEAELSNLQAAGAPETEIAAVRERLEESRRYLEARRDNDSRR